MATWKCIGCGYEMDSDEREECPMCGSTMTRNYNEDDDEDGIY